MAELIPSWLKKEESGFKYINIRLAENITHQLKQIVGKEVSLSTEQKILEGIKF